MAQITVQLQNGMVGTMDDSEFNPSTMKQLNPEGVTGASQGYSAPSIPSIPGQSSQTTPGQSYGASTGGSDITSNPQGMQKLFAALMLTNPKASSQLSSVYNLLKPSDAQVAMQQKMDQLKSDIASGQNYSEIGPNYLNSGIDPNIVRGMYNAGPIGQKYGQPTESIADIKALASGKPTAAQAANQKQNDMYNQTKSSIQNVLDTYQTIPGYEEGGPIRGISIYNPYSQSHEYENQRNGLAATLKSIAGAGAGSGIKATQSELASWANLLPTAGKTAEQNKTDLISLDKQMKGAFSGQGLDPQYLKQFGINTQGTPQTNLGKATGLSAQDLINPATSPLNINNLLGQAAIGTGKSIIGALGDTLATGANLMGVPKQNNPFISADKLKQYAAQTAASPTIPGTNAKMALAPFMSDVSGAANIGSLLMGLGDNPAQAAPTEAPTATVETPNATNLAQQASQPNPIQNLTRQATDLLNGGGSKKTISYEATHENGVPQNQTVMDAGVNNHLTPTGKIQAAAADKLNTGKALAETYQNSPEVITGSNLSDVLSSGLKKLGYDQQMIDQIVPKVKSVGELDAAPGAKNIISMNDLWQAAQKLEKYGPKALNIEGTGKFLNQAALDTARVLRQELATRVPESSSLANHYFNISDYHSNLTDPNGIQAKSGIVGNIINTGRQPINALLNRAYQISGSLAGQ